MINFLRPTKNGLNYIDSRWQPSSNSTGIFVRISCVDFKKTINELARGFLHLCLILICTNLQVPRRLYVFHCIYILIIMQWVIARVCSSHVTILNKAMIAVI